MKRRRSIIHVVYSRRKGVWLVRFVKLFDADGETLTKEPIELSSKAAAVMVGISWAKSYQPSSLRIHKPDGKIQQERTYPRSSDPRRTKG